jgi:hypothetical protein
MARHVIITHACPYRSFVLLTNTNLLLLPALDLDFDRIRSRIILCLAVQGNNLAARRAIDVSPGERARILNLFQCLGSHHCFLDRLAVHQLDVNVPFQVG